MNLCAAGAVLGGYDFTAEKSGDGVSIATGSEIRHPFELLAAALVD